MSPRDARCVLCPEEWLDSVKGVMRANIKASIAVGKVVDACGKDTVEQLTVRLTAADSNTKIKRGHEWWAVPDVK